MKSKKILIVVLILLVFFVVSGCGRKEIKTSSSPPLEKGD